MSCCGSVWRPALRSQPMLLYSRQIRPPCADWLVSLHWVMKPGGKGSLRLATRRPSPSGVCGWIDRLRPIAPHSWEPVASGRLTTSRSWSASSRAPGAGQRREAVRLSSCTLTRCPRSPDEAALKDRLLGELRRIYPELVRATTVAEEWLVNDDCPLWGTDPWEQRPTVRTPHPRIVLAGDAIRCDFPVALMERAATTGFLAANQLLHIYGVAGHDLWTVPMRSRHRLAAPLHRLVAR